MVGRVSKWRKRISVDEAIIRRFRKFDDQQLTDHIEYTLMASQQHFDSIRRGEKPDWDLVMLNDLLEEGHVASEALRRRRGL